MTSPRGKAFERAAKLCQKAGGKAGISAERPFLRRPPPRRLPQARQGPGLRVGNEHEWSSLYQADLSTALERRPGRRHGRLHPLGP